MELRAAANLLRNSRVGLPRPISRREMTDCLVPIFRASWAWVNPLFFLASIRALMRVNSGWRRSYSAFTLGFFRTSFL